MTLVRALDNDGVCQSYVGILDDSIGTPRIVRQVLPSLYRDEALRTSIRARIGDLLPIRHPNLLPIVHTFDQDGALYLVHDWPDTISLADLVRWCRTTDSSVPRNVFLHIAVQICNALEALHSEKGVMTGAPEVLHLQLRPDAVLLTRDGDVSLGNYGLLPGPRFAAQTGGFRLKRAYLAPEQTHADIDWVPKDHSEGSLRRLSPSTDLFCLGAVLYEVLVHKPMFEASSPLRTLNRVRSAQVTTQLLEVKEIFPGVDRILYRALSRNPRHRYRRAFVLREDLRGLMAQFSFSNIQDESRRFLEPLFRGERCTADELLPRRPLTRTPDPEEGEPTVLGKIDVEAIRRGQVSNLLGDLGDDLDDVAETGVFEAPMPLGPVERPVTYTEDGSDLHVRPSLPPGVALPAGDPPSDEALPTEEDLNPVSFTAEEIRLDAPEGPDPLDPTVILPAPSTTPPDRVGPPTGLLLAAGIGGMGLLTALCLGGAVVGALAIPRSPQVRPWRDGAVQPWVPLRVEGDDRTARAIEAAIQAMDLGDPREALRIVTGADPSTLNEDERRRAELMLLEIRAAAHERIYEQGGQRAHLEAAREAWSRYASLGDDRQAARAAQRLAELPVP